ncbi:MAG: hypothetical protein DCC58_21010 [Chloroflexi bacterium]|nr:MAG: hypothetical protein DCC58_21010 [Chloroflexota bacterium]
MQPGHRIVLFLAVVVATLCSSVALGPLEEPGDDATFSYSPANGWDYDFRLEMSAARPLDQFHTGATRSDIDSDLTIGQ